MNEINLTFSSGDVHLAGTLLLPEGRGSFPTALLIAGSGPLDRDGNHKKMALNLSRDLAHVLADAGWASFRFDKRGVGQSGGDYLSTGFYDELDDVRAALEWLHARPEVTRVVAVGHSAGSLMAAELAGQPAGQPLGEPALDSAVLLATTAQNGEATLRWQTEQMADHIVPRFVTRVLRLFGTSVVKQQGKAINKLKKSKGDTARIQMVKVNAKWMREFIAYDPVPALRAARCHLLAVTGSKDVQVDANDLVIVAQAAPAGSMTMVVADVDHILRHEPGPFSNPRRYSSQLKKPIDPRLVAAVVEWLEPPPPTRDSEEGSPQPQT